MKKLLYSTFLFLSCFFLISEVKAFTPNGFVPCYEDSGNLPVRNAASNGSVIGSLQCGEKIEVLSTVETSTGYKYYLTNGKITGYASGYYIITTKLSELADNYYKASENIDTYKKSLRDKGFPDSYIPYLLEIHARHPNWIFIAEKINLNWNDVINNESVCGRSLVSGESFNNGFFSTTCHYDMASDTFSDFSSDPGWYAASPKTVAFFMDPRNLLNEKYIFTFETLGYQINQTASVINSILTSSFWGNIYSGSGTTVGNDLVNACSEVGINSVHIASRINQEISGLKWGDSRIGGSFTYNGNSYSGYYNFFNIKSYCTNCSSIYTGYAYENGWNTPYKGLKGGASFVFNNYVGVGQDTLYYEKFDVSSINDHYTHQYMQNVSAVASEAGGTYNSYKNNVNSYLNSAITFIIPIYNEMPSSNSESPLLGNPNYYLKDLKINGTTINNFAYNNLTYNVSIPVATSTINISATKINSQGSINGIGNVAITSNKQTINVTSIAGNGDKITYTINITREDDPGISVTTILNNSSVKYNSSNIYGINPGTNVSSLINNVKKITNYANITIKSSSGIIKTNDSFRTGDTVSITSNNETKNYSIVIYGDVDGDGEITKIDALAVLRHYYGYVKYGGAYQIAADVNRDGNVDKLDCLAVLRDYYGYAKISQ